MIKYTSHSIQGKRWYQEDRIATTFTPIGHYFAIIDGHGGSNTAEYIEQYIKSISFEPQNYIELFEKLHKGVIEKKFEDGACLLLARISEEGEYEIAWVGDCVAFLQTNGETKQLNEIHQLSNPKEVERIEKQTGVKHNPAFVYLMSSTIREMGIMPTRTIGDKDFEIDGVSHVPEIIKGKLDIGESLILVTDGVTDVLENFELEETATDIVLKSYEKGSSDNISAIKITLE